MNTHSSTSFLGDKNGGGGDGDQPARRETVFQFLMHRPCGCGGDDDAQVWKENSNDCYPFIALFPLLTNQ